MTPFRIHHDATKSTAIIFRADITGQGRVLKVFRGKTAKRRAAEWLDAALTGWFSREKNGA